MKNWFAHQESRSIADLDEYYGIGWQITRINVPEKYRGQGIASQLLRDIIAEADREQVRLYLEIVPTGGLNYDQLDAWYRRHGFKPWKGILRRLPTK